MKRKIIYTLVLTLTLTIVNLVAQPIDKEKTDLMAKNCYVALTHENAGVVESAIFLSMQFKNRFPSLDDNEFIEVLNDIAKNSNSPVVSYKAQLARTYFKNIDLFTNIEVKSIKSENLVYEQIANKINSIMLANVN